MILKATHEAVHTWCSWHPSSLTTESLSALDLVSPTLPTQYSTTLGFEPARLQFNSTAEPLACVPTPAQSKEECCLCSLSAALHVAVQSLRADCRCKSEVEIRGTAPGTSWLVGALPSGCGCEVVGHTPNKLRRPQLVKSFLSRTLFLPQFFVLQLFYFLLLPSLFLHLPELLLLCLRPFNCLPSRRFLFHHGDIILTCEVN